MQARIQYFYNVNNDLIEIYIINGRDLLSSMLGTHISLNFKLRVLENCLKIVKSFFDGYAQTIATFIINYNIVLLSK